jgi:hypothetical protein
MRLGRVAPVLITAAWLSAAAPACATQWANVFEGGQQNNATLYSARATADGGYIVAGTTFQFGDAGDAWVMKLDGRGNVIWQRAYGGPSFDWASSVRPTPDGGYGRSAPRPMAAMSLPRRRTRSVQAALPRRFSGLTPRGMSSGRRSMAARPTTPRRPSNSRRTAVSYLPARPNHSVHRGGIALGC